MNRSRYIFSFLSFGIALLAFVPQSVFAGAGDNMSGWAWSSNIGWISFNSTNTGSAIDYGVNQNADGTLTGYAWSSSIGWIQFGGLSGFPIGSGTLAQNAQVVGSSLVGWARAIAADNNGWDGWISLSGTGYGVSVSGQTFSGYAWGGPVVGWVNVDPNVSSVTPPPVTGVDGCSSSTSCGITTIPPTPGFTLQCNGTTLSPGQTTSGTSAKKISATPSNFTGSITVSILSGAMLPGTTTATYSLDGGATYSSSPTANLDCSNTNSPYCNPQLNLSIHTSAPIPADGTVYPITVQGVSSSGGLSNQCVVHLQALQSSNQTPNPQFQEF